MLDKVQDKEPSKAAEEKKLENVKKLYQGVAKLLNDSNAETWRNLAERGNIVSGSRYSEMYLDHEKYAGDVKKIADFFTNKFSGSTTVADVVDFKVKYGVLPHKKIR